MELDPRVLAIGWGAGVGSSFLGNYFWSKYVQRTARKKPLSTSTSSNDNILIEGKLWPSDEAELKEITEGTVNVNLKQQPFFVYRTKTVEPTPTIVICPGCGKSFTDRGFQNHANKCPKMSKAQKDIVKKMRHPLR